MRDERERVRSHGSASERVRTHAARCCAWLARLRRALAGASAPSTHRRGHREKSGGERDAKGEKERSQRERGCARVRSRPDCVCADVRRSGAGRSCGSERPCGDGTASAETEVRQNVRPALSESRPGAPLERDSVPPRHARLPLALTPHHTPPRTRDLLLPRQPWSEGALGMETVFSRSLSRPFVSRFSPSLSTTLRSPAPPSHPPRRTSRSAG